MNGEDVADVIVGTDCKKDNAGQYPFALRFGTGGGNAVVKSPDGSTVTIKNIANGEHWPCRTLQVVSVTGTVADIVAVYENAITL